MGVSLTLQVSRRAAVTAVAVITTPASPSASACDSSSIQCWVERLVRAGLAVTLNGPSASAAA
jgi:hypothetical protein